MGIICVKLLHFGRDKTFIVIKQWDIHLQFMVLAVASEVRYIYNSVLLIFMLMSSLCLY